MQILKEQHKWQRLANRPKKAALRRQAPSTHRFAVVDYDTSLQQSPDLIEHGFCIRHKAKEAL
jgi:hypothetical protein